MSIPRFQISMGKGTRIDEDLLSQVAFIVLLLDRVEKTRSIGETISKLLIILDLHIKVDRDTQ